MASHGPRNGLSTGTVWKFVSLVTEPRNDYINTDDEEKQELNLWHGYISFVAIATCLEEINFLPWLCNGSIIHGSLRSQNCCVCMVDFLESSCQIHWEYWRGCETFLHTVLVYTWCNHCSACRGVGLQRPYMLTFEPALHWCERWSKTIVTLSGEPSIYELI